MLSRIRGVAPEFVVDHLVVGGGVVGLAIANALVKRFPEKTTYLVERHPRVGEEISSRNSEVVHAGLYYPENSLKTKLCLLGRHLMYDFCNQNRIPCKKTGKLVVATSDQIPYIRKLHSKAQQLKWPGLPTRLLNGAEVHEMEPNLSEHIVAALWSPETGIVDSHTLMETLAMQVEEAEGGEVVCSTRVVRVDRSVSDKSPVHEDGWVVQMVTGDSPDGDAVLAKTVISASGLSGPFLLNSVLPPEKRIPMYFARGSYASYHGPGISGISHLIYPCPATGPNAHAFESLGTHLTLDLQGKIKFGPDIEWLSPDESLGIDDLETLVVNEERAEFWKNHLIPNESRLGEMHGAVAQYLPAVELTGFQPDYVGIRPKLIPPGGGFQDFVIRSDYPTPGMKSKNPMISLLGIESPGLTSSLALGQLVANRLEEHQGSR
ncbi:hypothetical protein ONZ45_g492 [Pleurotus djamor]|nr:hypothetical protein ONZ45_g492 [Pleurotus djamor]